MLILEVTSTLNKQEVPYAIVGGYAVSLHGATRGTLDIDIVIPFKEKYFIAAEKALNKINLSSRLPVSAQEVFNFRKEYLKNRNLIAWSFFDNSNPLRIVDIILTEDLNDLETVNIKIKGSNVKIVSLDDLIKIKSKSARPQDLEDIKTLSKIKNENSTNS